MAMRIHVAAHNTHGTFTRMLKFTAAIVLTAISTVAACAGTVAAKPSWQELTPSQQRSLEPLAPSWNTLGEARKRKWIAISSNYSMLSPAEQAKLHSRMNEWVALSQSQRDQARLNFAKSKQLSSDEKAATWEAYQALSPEDRNKLAASAGQKPAGGATAAKPVPPKKLAIIPLTGSTQQKTPTLQAAKRGLNRHTLLPQPDLQSAKTLPPAQRN